MTMVRYRHNGRWHALTVEGHAERAVRASHGGFTSSLWENDAEVMGNIVCAAASMLSCTALRCVAQEQEAGGLVRLAYRQDSGDVRVEALATFEAMERVRIIFKTVITGFEMLAETYPQHVRVKIE